MEQLPDTAVLAPALDEAMLSDQGCPGSLGAPRLFQKSKLQSSFSVFPSLESLEDRYPLSSDDLFARHPDVVQYLITGET